MLAITDAFVLIPVCIGNNIFPPKKMVHSGENLLFVHLHFDRKFPLVENKAALWGSWKVTGMQNYCKILVFGIIVYSKLIMKFYMYYSSAADKIRKKVKENCHNSEPFSHQTFFINIPKDYISEFAKAKNCGFVNHTRGYCDIHKKTL